VTVSDERRIKVARVVWLPLSLVIILGGALVGWWLIGDLTESGVADPEYLLRAPDWAQDSPRRVGLVGVVVLAFGLLMFQLLVVRNLPRRAIGRLVLREFFLLVVGGFGALVLRLATLGYSGASFFGLTLFVGVPILGGSAFAAMFLVGTLVLSSTAENRLQMTPRRRVGGSSVGP
jgi:hypothetical protein